MNFFPQKINKLHAYECFAKIIESKQYRLWKKPLKRKTLNINLPHYQQFLNSINFSNWIFPIHNEKRVQTATRIKKKKTKNTSKIPRKNIEEPPTNISKIPQTTHVKLSHKSVTFDRCRAATWPRVQLAAPDSSFAGAWLQGGAHARLRPHRAAIGPRASGGGQATPQAGPRVSARERARRSDADASWRDAHAARGRKVSCFEFSTLRKFPLNVCPFWVCGVRLVVLFPSGFPGFSDGFFYVWLML